MSDGISKMDLTMAGEVFDDLRRSFDIVMQRLMKRMSETESDEAKITINLDVKLGTDFVPEFKDGKQNGGRDIKKPTFEHKISSSITVKDEMKGAKATEMELVWDEESKTYVLTPIIGGEQMNFADYMRQQSQNQEDKKEWDEPKMIEAHTPELPGPTDDETPEIIDGDFREVGADEVTEDVEPEDTFMDDGSGNSDFEYDEPEE